MERQCLHSELFDPEAPPIIFCISQDDPITKHIKTGQKVTYDLVCGDNGRLYAVDIRLAQDEDIAELLNPLIS